MPLLHADHFVIIQWGWLMRKATLWLPDQLERVSVNDDVLTCITLTGSHAKP